MYVMVNKNKKEQNKQKTKRGKCLGNKEQSKNARKKRCDELTKGE